MNRGRAGENLTGLVQGKDASDLEERFARALMKYKVGFEFRVDVFTAVSVPREDREVDFVAEIIGTYQAIEVDGEIGHKTQSQKERDATRDIFVNEALEKMGVKPIIRVPWTKLETQSMTNRTVRELL